MNNLSIAEFYIDMLRDERTEKDKTLNFANKIKKVPKNICISSEYFVKRERRERNG